MRQNGDGRGRGGLVVGSSRDCVRFSIECAFPIDDLEVVGRLGCCPPRVSSRCSSRRGEVLEILMIRVDLDWMLGVRGDEMDDETHLAIEVSMFTMMKMEWK